MNAINRAFLKLALLPKGIYKKMGVHIPHLTSILRTKLIMDDRRPTTLHQTRRNKAKKPVNLATVGTMFISALLGLLYLMSFSVGNDKNTQLTFYYSLFFFHAFGYADL
jgi:ABC-2 type transport system permease protein